MNPCKSCYISLNFTIRNIPKQIDFKKVSILEDNDVLVEILKNKNKFNKNNSFIILVNGSRYGIYISNTDKNHVYLKQYFLHYDSTKKNLFPKFVRFVKLVL